MKKIFIFILFLIVGSSLIPAQAAYETFVDSKGHVTEFVQVCLKKSGVKVPSPTLKDVVKATQRDWFLKGERWTMQNPRLTGKIAREILKLGKATLGTEPISPQKKKYEGILFLGGTAARVQSRLTFASPFIGNIPFHKLYLMTGKRPLEPFEKEKFPLLQNINDEGPMVRTLVRQTLPTVPQDKIVYVYSKPPAESSRATRDSTVKEFMKHKPKPGHYLAISNSYYIPYQELVIQNCLDKEYPESNISVECVGPGDPDAFQAKNDDEAIHKASVFLDNLSRILYNLDIRQDLHKETAGKRMRSK